MSSENVSGFVRMELWMPEFFENTAIFSSFSERIVIMSPTQ